MNHYDDTFIDIQNNSKPKRKIKYCPNKSNLMIVNKCPLKNIIIDNPIFDTSKSFSDTINNLVIIVNKLVIHTYQFLELFILHCYDKNLKIPQINVDFIKLIFRLLSKRTNNQGGKPKIDTIKLMNRLQQFYDSHYKHCIIDDDIICSTKLSYILAYEATDIVTNIKNNITEHFTDHVHKFINHSFNRKDEIAKIKKMKISESEKKKKMKLFHDKLRNIKTDILDNNNTYFVSDEKYHDWLMEHTEHIVTKSHLQKNTVNYDVCVNPQDYIKPLIYIAYFKYEIFRFAQQNKFAITVIFKYYLKLK